ncbi:hypothetical protein HPB49_021333 [Dermacentor silvarum]|uniref:Uncharacterized protein n=1 Tax=Dermacentor silvarum TaxID=543639 RepID=A0ACB8CZT2_DERSI|nr:hypothetical protein HPB49_021333 [Dermacentor silvarum]
MMCGWTRYGERGRRPPPLQKLTPRRTTLTHTSCGRRKRLLSRIRTQPNNIQLRHTLDILNTDILTHCSILETTNWNRICDSINSSLHTKSAWLILRSLLGPQPAPLPTIQKHLSEHGATSLLQQVTDIYVPPPLPSLYPEYTGPSNSGLDSPFTLPDLERALAQNNTGTTPGADHITYSLLKNMPDSDKEFLLNKINEHWANGTLPDEWTSSIITLIPKPGKPATLSNLRPISLTSCVGKTMERMVLARLTDLLDDTHFLPHNQIGFRPHMSTQDLFLLLHETFFQPSRCQVHALVTVDVRKAFDTLLHDAILSPLEDTGCGSRLYCYVSSFLRSRQAQFRLGTTLSPPIALTRGTPQGAVLSPTLFNLGLAPLAKSLSEIPHLQSILYADDITLWCTHGSPGEVEFTLQSGLNLISEFLSRSGMQAAPEKSELLLLSATKYQRTVNPLLNLTLAGTPIPRTSSCRVLGFPLQDHSFSRTIQSTITTCHQVTHLVRRVVRRRGGLDECRANQLVTDFALNKILYSLPYCTLTQTQMHRIQSALNTLYKAALHLPTHASTAKLYATGLFLPLAELLCLHRDRQLGRLSSSAQGHWLLQRAGIRPIDFPLYTPQRPLPSNLRCEPIPSNMTPHLHEGRRQARAHFHDPFPPDTVTCYVDAAYYQTHGSTACVTMPTPLGIPITSTAGPFSLPTSSLSLELTAIVHATHELTLLPPSPRYRICSDSMAAIGALRDNRLPDNLHDDLSDALSLLSPALVTVVWVPGHAGIIGNKLAHELAREINSRAPTIPWPCPPIADEAHFYKKTLKQHYKHLRHSLQTLPPPHPRLSTAQVRTLRAIQLNTLITPARLYLYRYRSDPSCPNCPSTYANVEHILFSCPAALQSPHYPNPPPPHWRVWLASAAFADQLAMVLLAEEYL